MVQYNSGGFPHSQTSNNQNVQSIKQNIINRAQKAGKYIDDKGSKLYGSSQSMYGASPKTALGKQLNPTRMPGALNYGFAGIGGVGNFMSNANAGMDFDDNLAQSAGYTAGTIGGGAAGTALGTAAAPFLAAIPVIGPGLAAASPLLGQVAGNMIGSNVGKSVAGGAWDLVDRDNDFSQLERESMSSNPESIGRYQEYLTPDQQRSLANYQALANAQNEIEMNTALFNDALAREQFLLATERDFQNQAALDTLNNRADMEKSDRLAQYQLAGQGSSNMFNSISNAVNAMAGLYAA